MKKSLIFVLAALLCFAPNAKADDGFRLALGANLFDLLDLGTMNVDVDMPVSRHFSLIAGTLINPWQLTRIKPASYSYIIQDKKFAFYAGARYWPWFSLSGFWVECRAQAGSYKSSGLWRTSVDSGHYLGFGASIGYATMISSNWNFEVGAGIMGAYSYDYTLYGTYKCEEILEQGEKWMAMPCNCKLAFYYIF